MLEREDGSRYQDGNLLGIADSLECGPDSHFRLAEAHVTADQAVHRAVVLHIFLDRLRRPFLIGSILVHEGRLQFFLEIIIGREGVALRGPAARIVFGASAMPKVKAGNLDGVTCATPLSIMSATPKVADSKQSRQAAARAMHNFDGIDTPAQLKAYFLGVRPGCIGETCAPALLLGFVLLLVFKLINWRVPVCFAGTVFILTGTIITPKHNT